PFPFRLTCVFEFVIQHNIKTLTNWKLTSSGTRKRNRSSFTSIFASKFILEVVLLPVCLLIFVLELYSYCISCPIYNCSSYTIFIKKKICFKQQNYSPFWQCSNTLFSFSMMMFGGILC